MTYRVPKPIFVMSQQIENINTVSKDLYYYKVANGGYGYTNSTTTTSFSTAFLYTSVSRYASSGTVPVDCTMNSYQIVGWKKGTDNDQIYVTLWHQPAQTNQDADTTANSLTSIQAIQIDCDAGELVNFSGALSQAFSAGDSWLLTLSTVTTNSSTADHFLQVSVGFEATL